MQTFLEYMQKMSEVYRFVIDGTPTDKLTLKQFLDNIDVEYEDIDVLDHKHYGKCLRRTVSDFDYLVHNERGKKYDLISVCPYLSCQSIFGGIPEDRDNDFRMLSIEEFELLLKILETDWIASNLPLSEFTKFKNKFIYEYWKNKDIGDFLQYCINRLENLSSDFDISYENYKRDGFLSKLLEDNRDTLKLYKLSKKYKQLSDEYDELHFDKSTYGTTNENWYFLLYHHINSYYIDLDNIIEKLAKENEDLRLQLEI